MSLFVLDCSVALAWAFESEWTTATQLLLRRCATTGAVVPGHWPLEVANALAVGERRGRLSAHDALRYLELAARRGLPLATQDKLLLAAARQAGTPVAGEGYPLNQD